MSHCPRTLVLCLVLLTTLLGCLAIIIRLGHWTLLQASNQLLQVDYENREAYTKSRLPDNSPH
jgi:hypothetical protein